MLHGALTRNSSERQKKNNSADYFEGTSAVKSLFNAADNAEIIDRINKLTASSVSGWGKMHVDQMLAHCHVALQTAFGEVKLKRSLMGMLFGSMARKQLLGSGEFKRNLPTDRHFIIQGNRNFNEEKDKLMNIVKRFTQQGRSAISTEAHPFFGKLTADEWDNLMWKHLDHHLRQFGA